MGKKTTIKQANKYHLKTDNTAVCGASAHMEIWAQVEGVVCYLFLQLYPFSHFKTPIKVRCQRQSYLHVSLCYNSIGALCYLFP